MKLWIVGFLRSDPPVEGEAWEFVGVFDEENKAVDACLDWRYFIGPARLNEITPEERHFWPNAYYPKADVQIHSA